MKRSQQTLLEFYKKPKTKTPGIVQSVVPEENSEGSGVAQCSEKAEVESQAVRLQEESGKSTNEDPNLVLASGSNTDAGEKNDIGFYVGRSREFSNETKMITFKSLWKPDTKYRLPSQDCGKFKRKFQLKWLDTFKWLAYSKQKEGAFCKFCVLFLESDCAGKGSHEVLGHLVKKPCTNLKDALELFRIHENTSYHKSSVLAADNIFSILDKKQHNIVFQLDSKRKEDAIRNRQKITPIIQTIRFCGRQQIPLRGHCDSGRISLEDPEHNDGNFRSLLRFRANSGDDILKDHLQNSSATAMYTSSVIQNEIISTFGTLIQSHIVNNVAKSGFFSVLADETTDITQTEQFSLCIRYFDDDALKIREDFLTFVPVYDVTGAGLAKAVQETLKNFGLDLHKMRGQGYDGAAAMRGQFRGVQSIIRETYPKAVYTHCVSHSLNLCLSDASKVQGIRNAFGVISEVCTFFRSSAKRTDILGKSSRELIPNIQATKLKTICETRWVLRHEGVLIFKEFLKPIVFSLEEIKSSSLGCESSRKAGTLLNCVCNFNFLICLFVLCKMLGYTYNLSEYLQSKNIDLVQAIDRVEAVVEVLISMRRTAEDKFQLAYEEAKNTADTLNVDESVPRICGIQRNKPNINFTTVQEYYRRTVYIPYLDDLISSLNERFISQKDTIKSLQYLLPSNAVRKSFNCIEPAVAFYESDLYGFHDVLQGEWELWKSKWSSVKIDSRPATATDALMECNPRIFPNIRQLLKILAVLPVSTSTVERSFSTLRRLKTYLRNTTSESRLVGLALLSIHRDITITDDMVIDKFINTGKDRKLNLIL